MSEKNKQEVSDIKSSVVQQANGNIYNNGMGYNDIRALIEDEIARHLPSSQEAQSTSIERFTEFLRKINKKLKSFALPHAEMELKTPHIQTVLRETGVKYAMSEDPKTREELLDLLIERLEATEDNEKLLIEDAIKILPNLSEKQGNFLASLFLREQIRFRFSPPRLSFLRSFIETICIIWMPFVPLFLSNSRRSFYSFISNYFGLFLLLFLTLFILLFILALDLQDFEINKRFLSKKGKSIDVFLKNTEILHPYVLMEKNDNYDIDHLKQIHCCTDGEKRNIFEKIDMAKEAYLIVFKHSKPNNHFSSSHFRKNIKDIYYKQKRVSNIRLTPVGEYIGKRIFDKITKQQQ